MRRFLIVMVAFMLAVPAVFAGKYAGVQMPDQITVSGKTLLLNGMGVRKKLWIKVYVAGLYLERRTANADEAVSASEVKRVVMHFLTNKATKSKMDNGWEDGFKDNVGNQVATLQSKINVFKSFFGDMHDGDIVDITIVPGEGTTVTINGQKKGTIQGDDFGHAVLKLWLGPEPPSSKMKAGMLGRSR